MSGPPSHPDSGQPNDLVTGEVAPPEGGPVIAGRYRLDRVIARGGMGVVYLAWHIHLGRAVALKIMRPPPDVDDASGFEERFRLEAETLAQLNHPNIVTLYDYGQTEDGRFYLALEYIEGPRFTDLLRNGPMPVDRYLRLMLQVCRGLRYAHKRGMIHRDLKPSNLLIRESDDGDAVVKVVDFGLVKVVEADQSITRAGLILGSPHCMAPEQVRGVDIDARADIYSLGILLFRGLTGKWPFHGETAASTMIAHVNEPVPRFAVVAPELALPFDVEDIVRRCLAKDPKDRPVDVESLQRSLEQILDSPEDRYPTASQHASSLSGARPATRAESLREHPLLFVGAIMLLVVIVGIGALVVLLWPQEPGTAAMAPATPVEQPAIPAADPLAGEVEPPQSADAAAPNPADPVANLPPAAAAPEAAPVAAPAVAAPPEPGPARPVPSASKPPAKAPVPAAAPDPAEPPPDGYLGLPEEF